MKHLLLGLFFSLPLCRVIGAEHSGKKLDHVAAITPTRLNINNVSTEFRNDGWTDRISSSGNSGFVFPKGSGRTAIFQSGLVWGAKTRYTGGDTLHVGGATYSVGLVPGKILSPGVREDPNLPKNRIYRVRPDYLTADLSVEATEEFLSQSQVRAQYALDWNQWPATDGAPFVDRNGNGTYEPAVDIPGKNGADQTIWYVCNDLDTARTRSLYGTVPLGIEMQLTVWAYNHRGALDNIIFKQYRLTNKSTKTFDSMYVCQWSDPDLGDAVDDFAGCDTALHLTYCYNGRPDDFVYFPLPPPAVGYQLLNAPMTASFAFVSGSSISDPPFTRDGARQWYNLLQGLIPISGASFIHPSVPGPTRFWYDGDPVAGTGRLDGVISAPSDRRIGACAGPFSVLPNETKDILIAQVAALGSNRLSSVAKLKEYSRIARAELNAILVSAPPKFDALVSFPSSTQATVQLVADGRPTRAQAVTTRLLRQDGSLAATVVLFDDGLHGDGGANDGIWGNATTIAREPASLYVTATTIDSLSRTFVWERIYENVTTSGQVRLTNPRVFSDNINSDGIVNPRENIRYGFTIANQTSFPIGGVTLTSQFGTEFKVIVRSGVPAGGVDSLRYDPNDPLSYFSFTAPDSGTVTLAFTISDLSANLWRDTVRFTVVPFAQPIRRSIVNHVAGRTEWEFDVRVVSPPSVLNRLYELTFADSAAIDTTFGDTLRIKVFSLRDLSSGTILLQRHPLPDQYAHNIPVTQGFKVTRGTTFGHVGLNRDSTRWISSFPVWARGYLFTADDHSAFNGGATTGFQLGRFYLGQMRSSFDASRSYSIEIRFDQTRPQKAYRLRRFGSTGSQYMIQTPNPFVDVPFSAWDVSNRSAPRQLTLAWRDQNNNSIWDPTTLNDGLEVVFVYNKTYDPTGTTQFAMPPNAIPNECTVGMKADIVYGLSLAVRTGHVLNESPGVLYLRPTYALTTDDRYTFNPTILVSVPESEVPNAYELYQNYPNPFNPSTTIKYQLAAQSKVTIRVFNLLGQEVKTLIDGVEASGAHQLQWDGKNNFGSGVATGVYFYRIETNSVAAARSSFVQVKKMMLLR